MSLTLTSGATSVTLSSDLYWFDEFQWAAVEQAVTRSLTGALIVQQSVKQAGRPITLQPEDDSSAALPRAVLDQLRAWADVPGLTLTLDGLRGVSRSVMFRQQDGAVEAKPFIHFSDVDDTDNYLVTLRFMEV